MIHFTLKELISTSTGLPNEPNLEQIKNLTALVDNILDPARIKLGKPIKVSSGFRSKSVNKKVGGSSTSQHLKGQAADLKCYDNKTLFNIIKELGNYDQLINEFDYSWVHVSFRADGKNRKQILKAYKKNGRTVYEEQK